MDEKNIRKNVVKLSKVLIKKIIKHPFKNYKLIGILKNQVKQSKLRKDSIPQLLLLSVTNRCNLKCVGCYFHALDCKDKTELDIIYYKKIFDEATLLNISLVTLVGGEPLIRKDIMALITNYKNILFSVYTNGLLINESFINYFKKNKNIIPFLSIEGFEKNTDARRGDEIFKKLKSKMESLKKENILFGTSITVTKNNLNEITSESFIKFLKSFGCFYISYVEFEPFSENDLELSLNTSEREFHFNEVIRISKKYKDIFITSYPSFEYLNGGCQASGVGFIHINPYGDVEPCNFINISCINIKDDTLLNCINNPFFKKLREGGYLNKTENGECALLKNIEEIKKLVN